MPSAPRFGAPPRETPVELRRQKTIGGREDMIDDTATTTAKERGLGIVARAAS